MSSSLPKLANTYTTLLKENDLSHEVLLKKVQDNTNEMKSNRLKMGEDSRVDEAIMITFLTSAFNDIASAYNKYLLFKNENERNNIKDKETDLKKFIELKNNIDKYTQLQIRKNAIEQDLNQNNLDPKSKEKHERDLKKIYEDINTLSDFFGYANEPDFIKNLEISEEKWYGKEGAEYLKNLRDLVPETLGEFREAGILSSDELSIKEIIESGVLDNSINKIKKELVNLESVKAVSELISSEGNKTTTNNLEQN